MTSSNGSWTIGWYRGAPVRLHWSLPLGALYFCHGAWAPGAWLAFALVILVHELGHAALVARYRHRVVAIDVHGLGGECSYRGDVTEWQRTIIAWGGVAAQGVLLVATLALLLAGLWPRDRFTQDLLGAFV